MVGTEFGEVDAVEDVQAFAERFERADVQCEVGDVGELVEEGEVDLGLAVFGVCEVEEGFGGSWARDWEVHRG